MQQAIDIEAITRLPHGYLEYGDFTFSVACYGQPDIADHEIALF